MANISIADLKLSGSGLFSGSENFIDSMKDMSENELAMTHGGGGYYGGSGGSGGSGKGSGGSGYSKKSGGSSYGYGYYCY